MAVGRHQPADLTELALEIEGAYAPLGSRRRARHRQRRLAVQLPALAGQLDRGRHHRHPQEHHRRARARPAEDALGALADSCTSTSPTSSRRSRRPPTTSSPLATSPSGSASSPRARTASTQSDWDEMAELGWTGLALPEEWGGQGLGIVELAVLFEEMGYALAPSPLFSNTIAGLALSPLRLRRPARALPAAAGRGQAARHPGALGRRLARRRSAASRWRPRADGDGLVLDGEKVLVMDAAAADFFLVATSDGRRHLVERGADGVTVTPRPRSTPPAASTRFASTASGSRPGTRCPAPRPTTTPSSTGSVSRLPPSRPGSPSGRWRWRSPTPRTASSSAGRSAPTRRSRTAARRCCWRPRTPARRSTAPPGLPTPSRSRCRWRPRWPRPTPPTPAGAFPTPRSRSTAGSASPGSTTCTSSSSAARPTRRCSATPSGTANASPMRSSPARADPRPPF